MYFRQSLEQLAQGFPRRGVAPVDELLFASRIDDPFRLAAQTLEIQIRIKAAPVKHLVKSTWSDDVSVICFRLAGEVHPNQPVLLVKRFLFSQSTYFDRK